jgi:hypothetical protein
MQWPFSFDSIVETARDDRSIENETSTLHYSRIDTNSFDSISCTVRIMKTLLKIIHRIFAYDQMCWHELFIFQQIIVEKICRASWAYNVNLYLNRFSLCRLLFYGVVYRYNAQQISIIDNNIETTVNNTQWWQWLFHLDQIDVCFIIGRS